MKQSASGFPWTTFLSRVVGAYTVLVVWVIRDARSRHTVGVIVALITAVIVSVIGYLWARPNPTRETELKSKTSRYPLQ